MERNSGLRFGNVSSFLLIALGSGNMKQLDLLDLYFPYLFVEEMPAEELKEAEFDDVGLLIRAVKRNGSFYTGSSGRVSQIAGRLCGTARGNREKERKTAELLQKKAAEIMCTDMEYVLYLQDHLREMVSLLNDEQLEVFALMIEKYLNGLMDQKETECDPGCLFPLDEEVFEGIVLNSVKQFQRYCEEGLVNAYLWLLCGSLLRNETGRILRLFDSSFININRQPSEDGSFGDRLNYLLHPEEYEHVYYGGELERKYPGIEFYCDACNEHLNEQEGFDDHLHLWKCTKCGYENEISAEVIYESREDRRMGKDPIPAEEIMRAIQKRRDKEGK